MLSMMLVDQRWQDIPETKLPFLALATYFYYKLRSTVGFRIGLGYTRFWRFSREVIDVLFLLLAEAAFRALVIWLEDQKIRHYTIEDRAALRQANDEAWPDAFKKVAFNFLLSIIG
jgi:RNA transcription, translation and transport factor protein